MNTDNLLPLARQLVANLEIAQQTFAALKAKIEALEEAGIANASPSYRDGKYLYLIFPMVDGERKREYIGADPEKIAAALARIERNKQHSALTAELQRYDAGFSRAAWQLRDLVDTTKPPKS